MLKWPPDQAAPAHPTAHRITAEHRLHQISQKSPDGKEPEELIKTATFCKALLFLLKGLLPSDRRIGLLNSGLHMSADPLSQPFCPASQFPVKVLHLFRHFLLVMKQRRVGYHRIQCLHSEDNPHQDLCQKARQQFIKNREIFISITQTEGTQNSPEQGIGKADITVEIPFFSGVIPPFSMLHPLQRFSRKPFHCRRHDHTAQE